MTTSEGNFQRTARASLAAIDKHNGKTNAILTKLEGLAMEQAAKRTKLNNGATYGVAPWRLHHAQGLPARRGIPDHVWFGTLCRADFEVRFRRDCAVASGGSDLSREEQSHRVLLWRYR